ncbi:MAG: DUF1330 domain-containing protein [Acidobacteria bacterium]|nr:DUF1330 domain-containing protein [Acidobacteriota bacterium]
MSAYCIFDITQVVDEEKLGEYRQRVGATVEQYGGRYVVRGGEFEVVEGDWHPVRLVVLEFPSLEKARQWYNSEDYRELKELRLAATHSNAVIVEGL